MMPTFVEEYRTMDKSTWGTGPWRDEPDKAVWVDETTDLDCMVVRSGHSGALCGYVGVPGGHPDFGSDYDSVPVEVHGGLTFADRCEVSDRTPEHGICHLAQPGRPEPVWWLGFDCSHAFDLSPARAAREGWPPLPTEIYRDLAYLVREVARLASQLAARR